MWEKRVSMGVLSLELSIWNALLCNSNGNSETSIQISSSSSSSSLFCYN